MYEVEIQHLGQHYGKSTNSLEQAMQWAESAVYETGAEYSAVYNLNGSLYCEYEL